MNVKYENDKQKMQKNNVNNVKTYPPNQINYAQGNMSYQQYQPPIQRQNFPNYGQTNNQPIRSFNSSNNLTTSGT